MPWIPRRFQQGWRRHSPESRRVAADDGVRGHVVGHDRAGLDDSFAPDRESGEHGGAGADPGSIGSSISPDRVAGGEGRIRADCHVVADV